MTTIQQTILDKLHYSEADSKLATTEREIWSLLDVLPPELTVLILSYVQLIDLGHISTTCKLLNNFLDTDEFWKQIYELKFDAVKENKVNPSQGLNWKRMVIDVTYLDKWRKEFSHSTNIHAFTFSIWTSERRTSYVTPDEQYQVFVARNFIYAVVNLKMAGKFIPFKVNPISLRSGLTYTSGEEPNRFKTQLIKHHSFIAPKKGVYVVPESKLASTCFPEASNGQGDFLINLYNSSNSPLVLWQVNVHGLAHHNATPPILSFNPPSGTHSTWEFNKNYVVCLAYDAGEVTIINLSKRCLHCNPMSNTGSHYEREMKNCDKGCAIVYKVKGNYRFIFASRHNPDLVMALAPKTNANDFELIIWNKGIIDSMVPFMGLHGLTAQQLHLTEHVTERDGVKRHWFGNYCEDQSVFVDLNASPYPIPIQLVGSHVLAWVPNENKVALGFEAQVTMVDLDAKAWCSVLTPFPRKICALTFSKNGQILFVTTSLYVFACYWKTGRIIESFYHDVNNPQTTHFVMDQLVIVSSTTKSHYFKLRSKLDI